MSFDCLVETRVDKFGAIEDEELVMEANHSASALEGGYLL